jgi:hypothetical protein
VVVWLIPYGNALLALLARWFEDKGGFFSEKYPQIFVLSILNEPLFRNRWHGRKTSLSFLDTALIANDPVSIFPVARSGRVSTWHRVVAASPFATSLPSSRRLIRSGRVPRFFRGLEGPYTPNVLEWLSRPEHGAAPSMKN